MILKSSGEVLFIGPADNNAKELYEFNKKIFNLAMMLVVSTLLKLLVNMFSILLSRLDKALDGSFILVFSKSPMPL